MIITSVNNEKIKNIKKLYEKKYRDIENKYIIEGVKIIYEAYKNKKTFIDIIICEEILDKINIDKEFIQEIINTNENKIIFVSKNVFEHLSDTISPQGILAVLNIENENINIETDNILFLDKIQDAGNLGTIIRTASAFGFNTIVLNKGCADMYNPKVIRSAMGNIFKLNILSLKDEGIKYLLDKNIKGYKIYATALYNAKSIYNVEFSKKKIIIMGNEANGISNNILDISNQKVFIPMDNETESLNVAIATAIVLSEIKRVQK